MKVSQIPDMTETEKVDPTSDPFQANNNFNDSVTESILVNVEFEEKLIWGFDANARHFKRDISKNNTWRQRRNKRRWFDKLSQRDELEFASIRFSELSSILEPHRMSGEFGSFEIRILFGQIVSGNQSFVSIANFDIR